jgi:hypothetical protein
MAGGPGFEPRLTESESAVLPLNYPPKPWDFSRLRAREAGRRRHLPRDVRIRGARYHLGHRRRAAKTVRVLQQASGTGASDGLAGHRSSPCVHLRLCRACLPSVRTSISAAAGRRPGEAMLRGSSPHAPVRMAMGIAVGLTAVFALGTVTAPRAAAAADAPSPTSSASSPAAAPAASPRASTPSDAPAVAPPSEAPAPSPSEASAAPPSPPAATELDGPAPRPQPGAGGSTQSGLPGCAVWTDRCVICQRDAGVIACSNIGIACQPQPLMCLRPEATPEKKDAN